MLKHITSMNCRGFWTGRYYTVYIVQYFDSVKIFTDEGLWGMWWKKYSWINETDTHATTVKALAFLKKWQINFDRLTHNPSKLYKNVLYGSYQPVDNYNIVLVTSFICLHTHWEINLLHWIEGSCMCNW